MQLPAERLSPLVHVFPSVTSAAWTANMAEVQSGLEDPLLDEESWESGTRWRERSYDRFGPGWDSEK